jgi:hypothetical protein
MRARMFMESEQRKCKRFLVRDNVFAALRNGFKKVGKIDDISLTGLGFSYLKNRGDMRPHDHEYQVDIFLPQNGFHLFNIPCRAVYEKTSVTIVEGAPVKLSRCGLHFGKLSKMQLSLLEFIITRCTVKRKPREKILAMEDDLFETPGFEE